MLVKPVQPTFGITIHVADQDVHILGGGNSHGIPVVLLHGCGSLAQEILLPFDNSDIRIIAPDRPGYGLSTPAAPAERGPEGQSFWLERLLTSLDLSEVRIVAHSIGSVAALHLAARRPDLVRGLFLISPIPFLLISRTCRRLMWSIPLPSARWRTSCAPQPRHGAPSGSAWRSSPARSVRDGGLRDFTELAY
ncbi:alpha/beta fold hydrolase [Rhizobium leguminosarum]|nr:alpha/beta fold hydrolase [Rhizobium leguminosarum]